MTRDAAAEQRFRLVVVAALLSLATAAAAESPRWACRTTPAVAWAAVAGAEAGEVVLLLTRDGKLRVLDATTGGDQLDRPIELAPGTRLATLAPGTNAPLAVCFNRHAVYAISRAGIQWQYGPSPNDQSAFPDDPEFLTGWVAAGVTEAGVVVVDRGGGVVLLDRDTGTPRWQHELAALPVVRLHVAAHWAAILARRQGDTTATFLDLTDETPGLRTRVVSKSWPLWSALADDTLAVANGFGITTWTARGRGREIEASDKSIPATAVALFAPAISSATSRPVSPLLLLATDNAIQAWQVDTGAPAWRCDVRRQQAETRVGIPSAPRLHVHGRHFVVVYDNRRLIGGEAATGTLLVNHTLPPDCRAFATHADSAGIAAITASTRGRIGRLRLSLTQSQAVVETVPLDLDTPPSAAFWVDDGVVLVCRRGLQAYVSR